LHDEENVFESRSDVIEVESHTRKKVGRRPLPDHLERRDEEYDIPEDEKICNCGHRLNEIVS
jgi:transposase